jgi:blocked-early-in-transport protein 1
MHQRKARGSNHSSSDSDMYKGGYGDIEGGRRGNRNGFSSRDTNTGILEQQNNERINELSEHVARLKGLTIDIGDEVRQQNSLLDGMNDGFQNTRDLLHGSLMRIGTMLESGGAKHMCYLVGFSVFVMVFLWWLMKYQSS